MYARKIDSKNQALTVNIAVSCLIIFQLGADLGVSNPSMKSMKAVMRIMSVVAIPLTAQFPAVSVAIALAYMRGALGFLVLRFWLFFLIGVLVFVPKYFGILVLEFIEVCGFFFF